MTTHATELFTGDGRLLTVGDISELYRNGLNLASPKSGKIQHLGSDQFSISAQFKTVDFDNLESIETFKIYSLTTSSKSQVGRCIDSVRCISDAHGVAELVSVASDNGRFLARLKKSANGAKSNDTNQQFLEIWDRSKLVKTIDTSDLEAHGSINIDSTFSSFQWSPFGEQDKLLYVCQPKRKKHLNFFKPEPATSRSNPSGIGGDAPKLQNRGEECKHKDDWGETLSGIEHTMIAVLDVGKNCEISVLDVEGLSLGSARWLDNGTKTVSVAYLEEPRKLGIVHCNNRPSKILVHDWSRSPPAEVLKLESESHCMHTPRVDHSGNRFAFLKNECFGAHYQSSRLHIFDLSSGNDEELIDKATGEIDLFIFPGNIPENCFSKDNKHILFTKGEVLVDHMVLFDLEKSRISKIKFPTTGVSVLDFKHDIILATGSELDTTPTLFVAALSPPDVGELVAWHQIEDCVHQNEIEHETYKVPTSDGQSFCSAVLVSPNLSQLRKNFPNRSLNSSGLVTSQDELPTMVLLHGGPHSQFSVTYTPLLIFYARLGLKVLILNYRGSSGVSEEYLRSLIGKVGKQDVDDCLHCISYFVQNKVLNPNKLIVRGGSHGGFLACHLSCQKDFKFTSAIIINPVVDLSTLHATSDIPDWSYTCGLGHKHYNHNWVPNSTELAAMFECSPFHRFRDANVPTLMCLGSQDKRVPMFQGERWYQLLKSQGVDTECKVYNDGHGLRKVDVSADMAMSSAIWILQKLRR